MPLQFVIQMERPVGSRPWANSTFAFLASGSAFAVAAPSKISAHTNMIPFIAGSHLDKAAGPKASLLQPAASTRKAGLLLQVRVLDARAQLPDQQVIVDHA